MTGQTRGSVVHDALADSDERADRQRTHALWLSGIRYGNESSFAEAWEAPPTHELRALTPNSYLLSPNSVIVTSRVHCDT